MPASPALRPTDPPPSDSAEVSEVVVPRRRRRRRDKDESRRLLVKAAFDLLAEGQRVTTVEVTRRAGLAQSSFYAHFSDVDDCSLVAVQTVVERIERIAARRKDILRTSPMDRQSLAANIEQILEDPDIGDTEPVFSRFKYDPGPIGDVVRDHLSRMRADLLEDTWKLAAMAGVEPCHREEFALQADLIVGTIIYTGSAVRQGRYRDAAEVARVLARNFWATNIRTIIACGGDPKRLRDGFPQASPSTEP